VAALKAAIVFILQLPRLAMHGCSRRIQATVSSRSFTCCRVASLSCLETGWAPHLAGPEFRQLPARAQAAVADLGAATRRAPCPAVLRAAAARRAHASVAAHRASGCLAGSLAAARLADPVGSAGPLEGRLASTSPPCDYRHSCRGGCQPPRLRPSLCRWSRCPANPRTRLHGA
jgi:hypothetical protein